MKEIKGTYDQITARDFYKDMNTQDYYHITLTDEEDVPEAIGKLRTIYPNIMRLDYDNTRTRTNNAVTEIENIELKSPLELFKEFYVIRNNQTCHRNRRSWQWTLLRRYGRMHNETN